MRCLTGLPAACAARGAARRRDEAARQREGRRTAIILAASQAIVGSAAPIALSVGGLAGYYLLEADKSLATAPVTGYNVGVALGALPAAAILRAAGQRTGFMLGTFVTAIGGAAAAFSIFQSNFWLFALSLAIIGVGGAFVQQFRFAAADNAPPAFKARAISFVLAGGVITAVLGPQIVIFTHAWFADAPFAGSFLAIPVVAAFGALILSMLPRGAAMPVVQAAEEGGAARPLREIALQPRFFVGLLCGVGTFALMVFVMTGAPLAMVGCGFSADEATLGISWHVMAMFAPSFFTGRLIARFGVETIVAVGLVLADCLRGRRAFGHPALAVLDGADPAWPRLEFRLYRRHSDRCRKLSSVREGQGAGLSRPDPFFDHSFRFPDGGSDV